MKPTALATVSLGPLGLLLFAGCRITLDSSGLRVDGVSLEAEHDETLEVGAWDPGGITLEACIGEVRVEPTSGRSSIRLTLHETEVGDARASYEDGRVVVRTESGEPAAIGDVLIRSNGPLPSLVLQTGMGDLEVRDVAVLKKLHLETGMGDVDAREVGEPDHVVLTSGLGDVTLAGARCRLLEATSGMGDLDVRDVSAEDAELSSGLGDVELVRSRFGSLDVETGLGDIDCDRTSYERGSLETGLGSVRRD